MQKRAVRIVMCQHRLAHTAPMFRNLQILKVHDIAKQQLIILMHRKITSSLPLILNDFFIPIDRENIRTRKRKHFLEPFTSKLYRTRVAAWKGPIIVFGTKILHRITLGHRFKK